jgi:hypothetical protein
MFWIANFLGALVPSRCIEPMHRFAFVFQDRCARSQLCTFQSECQCRLRSRPLARLLVHSVRTADKRHCQTIDNGVCLTAQVQTCRICWYVPQLLILCRKAVACFALSLYLLGRQLVSKRLLRLHCSFASPPPQSQSCQQCSAFCAWCSYPDG